MWDDGRGRRNAEDQEGKGSCRTLTRLEKSGGTDETKETSDETGLEGLGTTGGGGGGGRANDRGDSGLAGGRNSVSTNSRSAAEAIIVSPTRQE